MDIMMDSQQCPRCKTTKYRNPSLKLMVNVCGHSLCENCIELLFIRGSGACPECGVPLRRSNFRVQLFENTFVEKEVDIRRRILKDYNKKEEDFKSLREYNDYLELIETIVYNLANNIDVEETKRQIEQYKKDNKELIVKNKSKLTKDEELIAMLIEQEEHATQVYKSQVREDNLKDKMYKVKHKQALIDDLMFSEGPAEDILAKHKATLESEPPDTGPYKKTVFTAERGGVTDCIPMQLDDALMYEYTDITFETLGPTIPDDSTVIVTGYIQNVRRAGSPDLAGGYQSVYGCQRALMDAFNSLIFEVQQPPMIEDPV